MLTYKFKYRKKGSFFWKTKIVVGHSVEMLEEHAFNHEAGIYVKYKYVPNPNAMVLYFPDGTIERIGDWNSYDQKLGLDWKMNTKKDMSKEAGQEIQLNL